MEGAATGSFLISGILLVPSMMFAIVPRTRDFGKGFMLGCLVSMFLAVLTCM